MDVTFRGGCYAAATAGHHPAMPLSPVTITFGAGPPGPAVPADFAGLSFERGPLNPGNAGVAGYLFNPGNQSLVTLFRNLGLGSLRIGGGSVEDMPIAGTGSDGYAGIDNLFAFAVAAGVRVIYSLRLLNPADQPVGDLSAIDARIAGYIWDRYRASLASFAIGNEPDWHASHSYPGHPFDPAIYEETPGVPGSAYASYLADWRDLAAAVGETAPGAPLSGPDTGAYTPKTNIPGPAGGVSWTEQFARDEGASGRIAELTQHYYVGGGPGGTSAGQAIANMLSPDWVNGTAIATQPEDTVYTPYPWLYASNLAPVTGAGLRYRLTECNDYLTGVPGASDAFASALWALDCLHWWATHGAAGVNFHNKQWLYTDTIVPDPAAPGSYKVTPKGYGLKAFTIGSGGRAAPVTVTSTDGINLTAYRITAADGDYLTIINKTQGATAVDATATIASTGPAAPAVEVMALTGGQPGDATGATATLGGAAITGSGPWQGRWCPLPADPQTGIRVTVRAATAVIVRMRRG